MYIDSIAIENMRTFQKTEIEFLHPNQAFDKSKSMKRQLDMPKPKLSNVNLLLGNNSSGKTTMLKAIAMAALGPAMDGSGIQPYSLVRKGTKPKKSNYPSAEVLGTFTLHDQDVANSNTDNQILKSKIEVWKRGEIERFVADGKDSIWEPVFETKNDAFFIVGYGATRRVEPGENLDMGARTRSKFGRAQRIQGLFEESYSLIPLTHWLPKLKSENPGRHKQVCNLLNRVSGPERFQFTGELEQGDYLFQRGETKVPFQALSDGYRAFFGWVGDLLYHVCFGCPSGKKLVENHGIVLVDEVDLHLHPKWQLSVITDLAKALPKIQFIFTSHSPLVAGSLEWMNVIFMKNLNNTSEAERIRTDLHGLDADQVLLTDFFGLETTRAPAKERQLADLTERARSGDKDAAKQLLAQLSQGMESKE